MTLRHVSRSGDTYEIELDDEGNFSSAVRFMDQIGRDPIHYEKLSDLPIPHVPEIEHLIWTKRIRR